MNWQTLFGYSGTADWILLTAFHSIWFSLAAFLLIHFRRLRAPTVRSAWCAFALIMLLALPLITLFIPQVDLAAQQPNEEVFAGKTVTTAEAKAPLLNNLLNITRPLNQARIDQWKIPMNIFGFLWLAVTLGFVGRLLYELTFLKGYCNNLEEVENDRISAILQEINESFGFLKKPRFFISPELTSPISMGMRTPLVLLPSDLYRSIGDEELRAILLHELAHIYHYDHVLGLLQRLVKAIYWWNPFVYRLCNAFSIAREEVSDNYAISGMGSARSYATLLVSLVEKTCLINRMPCTAGMANPYASLETRIKNIVSKERDMRLKTDKRTISTILVTSVLICGFIGVGSQVKVFGVGPASISEDAVAVKVKIINKLDSVKIARLDGFKLVLEAPDNHKYESSNIKTTDQEGFCEFSELIQPGEYTLIMSFFNTEAKVLIPPSADSTVSLQIIMAQNGVAIQSSPAGTMPD